MVPATLNGGCAVTHQPKTISTARRRDQLRTRADHADMDTPIAPPIGAFAFTTHRRVATTPFRVGGGDMGGLTLRMRARPAALDDAARSFVWRQ